MLYILGVVPYAIMGMVMSSIGYGLTTWQFYAIFACMYLSGILTLIRGIAAGTISIWK